MPIFLRHPAEPDLNACWIFWIACTTPAVGKWSSWWTSTTSRSSTCSTIPISRPPIGTTCAGSTALSRTAPNMSDSSSSPGVSIFSKVSLFSGLNNLKDISLDPRFATICGYTDTDIDNVFGPELEGLDREAIRTWYNGYHWRGGERVCNPYDVLLLLDNREFRPYWFETGSPAFLFRMLMEKSVSPMELENGIVDTSLVSKFDVGDIGIEALLFQTGYLTIAEELRDDFDNLYRLDYPNLEVRISLNRELMRHLGKPVVEATGQGRALCALLEAHDFAGFGDCFRSFLSGIPYQWHATADLARYEAWYASLLHMCFRGHRRGSPDGGFLESWPREHGGSDRRAGVRAGIQYGGGGCRRRAGCGDRPDARSGAMRRSTATAGSRSIWSAWRAEGRLESCWRSRPSLPDLYSSTQSDARHVLQLLDSMPHVASWWNEINPRHVGACAKPPGARHSIALTFLCRECKIFISRKVCFLPERARSNRMPGLKMQTNCIGSCARRIR